VLIPFKKCDKNYWERVPWLRFDVVLIMFAATLTRCLIAWINSISGRGNGKPTANNAGVLCLKAV